jgi:hypothetical protein
MVTAPRTNPGATNGTRLGAGNRHRRSGYATARTGGEMTQDGTDPVARGSQRSIPPVTIGICHAVTRY